MKLGLELSVLLCCRYYTFPIPLIVVVSLFINGTSNRGQLPAQHTKVVDESQRPLKTGSLGNGEVCGNDVLPSKPCSQGRGEIDVLLVTVTIA